MHRPWQAWARHEALCSSCADGSLPLKHASTPRCGWLCPRSLDWRQSRRLGCAHRRSACSSSSRAAALAVGPRLWSLPKSFHSGGIGRSPILELQAALEGREGGRRRCGRRRRQRCGAGRRQPGRQQASSAGAGSSFIPLLLLPSCLAHRPGRSNTRAWVGDGRTGGMGGRAGDHLAPHHYRQCTKLEQSSSRSPETRLSWRQHLFAKGGVHASCGWPSAFHDT